MIEEIALMFLKSDWKDQLQDKSDYDNLYLAYVALYN